MAAGNPNYDAILSSTIADYRSQFADNVSQSFFLFYWLTTQGRKDYEDGGESLLVQLMYGKNSTVKSYSGYDVLDTTPQEGLTSAKYPWKQVAGSISISRKEERQNSGEHRIIKLLQAKVDQTEITMRDELNRQMFADGTGNDSKDFFGLELIVENGSAWGTLGGIDRSDAANAWWRNQYLLASTITTNASFANSGLKNMRRMYRITSRGNEHPDFGITTGDVFEAFEETQVQNQRFVDSRVANSHFELIKFKGMILGNDEQCPAGVMFMLSSPYLGVTIDKETDFITTDFIRPQDQDAKTAQILLMGNMTCSNCARQGRIDGITTP